MLKLLLLFFAVGLVALAAMPLLSRGAPQNAPTPALAPAPPAAAPEQAAPPTNPVKATAESQAKAKGVYQIDCAMCHGDNGNGKTDLATSMSLTLPDWTDPKALANQQDGELFNIIRNGKGDKMPPEGTGRATDTEVWNLVIYIRSFSKPQPATPAAATK
jgi:mono/diheme cytochrome c family protein